VASQDLVGLIPAAGQAMRIAPLPCSKELYPVGFWTGTADGGARPKVVSHYLLEKMQFAGICNAYFVLRSGKWDIPAYFGDGSIVNMNLAYLTLSSSWGVPFTLDHAYSFVRNCTVAFGFPDILFESDDAFAKLLARQSDTRCDIVLGVCRKRTTSKYDVVAFDNNGTVRDLVLSSEGDALPYSWAVATWGPAFTEFLHGYVGQHGAAAAGSLEPTAGHALQASIRAGLKAQAVVLSESPYLDIGTPDDLETAIRRGIDGQL
jgi:glucose-1-phosphate thymidylyltransferase